MVYFLYHTQLFLNQIEIYKAQKLDSSFPKYILDNIKPNLTFILKVNISKALQRLKKRKKKNRYDKFSKNFYVRVQKAFIDIAKKNKNKYFIVDNSEDSQETEKIILKKFIEKFVKWEIIKIDGIFRF